MGKDIIINSGDFSVNGFLLDINVINDATFVVGESYSNNPPGTNTNTPNRCRFYLNIDSKYTVYNRIKMEIKNGFDYVFGIKKSDSVTKWYKGNETETSYGWVTNTQEVIAPVSVGDVVYVNFRYDDNTTVFANDTVISDIVDSIVLTR